MELSDDQKKRILEEEHQRLAEEQYRTQVRQELHDRPAATNPTTPVVEPPKTPKRHDPISTLLTALLVIVLVIAGSLALIGIIGVIGRKLKTNASEEPYAPSVVATKHTEKIGTGQFVVAAGKVFYFKVPINDVQDIRIAGHFLALGGRGNDIDVVLADEANFGQWMDGQQAKVFYQSGRSMSNSRL
jgi:hypothetical protein